MLSDLTKQLIITLIDKVFSYIIDYTILIFN